MKIDRSKKHLSISAGSSQSERINTILNSDYFKIDERGLAEYLSFIYKYAESVRFYNQKNKPYGNWQSFLDNDLTVLLSRIAIIDSEKLDREFNELLFNYENEIDDDRLLMIYHKLQQKVFDLILMLDSWYKASHGYSSEEDNELANIVQNAIEYRLGKRYQKFKFLVSNEDYVGLSSSGDIDFQQLDKIWEKEDQDSVILQGETTDARGDSAVKQLTFLFKDFLKAVTHVIQWAPSLLEKSLTHDHHAPQNAMLITFLKLYEHVKKDLNQITKKHLDYYYFHKLQQKYREAIPDHVHLYFQLADHMDEYIIEKGSLLAAGVDDEGFEYLYKTDEQLEVNKGYVSDVKVIYLSKNPLIAEGQKYKLISNVYKSHVASSNGAVSLNGKSLSFPTFGEEQYELGEKQRSMEMAEIGFALSSPVLLMKEGQRKVNIDLTFDLKSMSSLVSFLEDFSKEEKLSADGAFHKVFAKAFDVQLSSEEGWLSIEEYKIAPKGDWTNGVMSLYFELDLSSPIITPIPEGDEEAELYNSQWPVMKMVLSTARSMYAYSYLRDLILDKCTINVEVNEVKSLVAFNNLGKLDISSPFYPFGTTPNLGAYMLVGYDELFKKEITDLKINMLWHNLPRMQNGFKEYYRKYDKDVTNESFKVSLRALSGYQFFPHTEEKLQVFDLFKTKPTDSGKTAFSTLTDTQHIDNVDLEALQIKSDFKMQELPDYDNTVRSGYLKLELVAPEMGFGHDKYSTLFANEVIEKSKGSNKEGLDLPNIPFAPQLRSMSLNYKATSKIFMDKSATRRSDPAADERIYHLHPFGARTIFQNSIPVDQHMLPQFAENGYLLLGLQGLKAPDTITLYFRLERNPSESFNIDLPEVHWQYLVKDEWIDFNKSDIIYDTTNNFTVSGIIKLNIPADITENNSILPDGKIWLSARVEGDVKLLSRTKAIYTQAVTATWTPHKPNAQWYSNIPPNTIQRFKVPKSEIAGVFQPSGSFLGVRKEDDEEFYARVSERLRHKNRAVTPWDYERLILEKFPFIDRVKCISPIDGDGKVKSGEMIIVAVPRIRQNYRFYLPYLNFNTLNEIHNYISRLGSPFANIKVANPVYERVKINCSIKFIDNNKKGEYLNQLHEDLRKFICPWFYNPEANMNFGGYVKHEEVLTYLESLDYLTFITKLSVVIVHYENDEYSISDSMVDEKTLYASTPWSVLVPIDKHQVNIIEKTIHETPEKAAIESMRLGGDFVVTDVPEQKVDEGFPPYKKGEDKDYFIIEIDI